MKTITGCLLDAATLAVHHELSEAAFVEAARTMWWEAAGEQLTLRYDDDHPAGRLIEDTRPL